MPKHLLIADDSITIQKVVAITFAREDFKVTTVDNGDDAIARARELKPDVILADVVMPRKNGYELCAAVKGDPALQHIPVVLLAGTFEAFDEARARAARADGHLPKPFESQALINKVKEVVERPPSVAAAPRQVTLTPPAPPTLQPAASSEPAPRAQAPVPVVAPPAAPPARPVTPARPGSLSAVPPPREGAVPAAPRAAPPAAPRAAPPLPPPPPIAPPFAARAVPPPPAPPFAARPPPAPPVAPPFAARPAPPAPQPPLPPDPAPPHPHPDPAAMFARPVAPAAPRPPVDLDLAPPPADPGLELDFGVVSAPAAPRGAPSAFEIQLPPRAAAVADPEPEPEPEEWADIELEDVVEDDEPANAAAVETDFLDLMPPPAAEPALAATAPAAGALDDLDSLLGATTDLQPEPEPAQASPASPADEFDFGDMGTVQYPEEPQPPVAFEPVAFDAPEPAYSDLEPERAAVAPADDQALALEAPAEPPGEALELEIPAVAAMATEAPRLPQVAANGAQDGGEALLREALSKASREVIERVAWEVVPELAEVIIREHLERLAKDRQNR